MLFAGQLIADLLIVKIKAFDRVNNRSQLSCQAFLLLGKPIETLDLLCVLFVDPDLVSANFRTLTIKGLSYHFKNFPSILCSHTLDIFAAVYDKFDVSAVLLHLDREVAASVAGQADVFLQSYQVPKDIVKFLPPLVGVDVRLDYQVFLRTLK